MNVCTLHAYILHQNSSLLIFQKQIMRHFLSSNQHLEEKGLSQCVKLKSGFVFLPTFLIGGFLLLLTPFSYHKCWDTSEHFQKDPFLGDDAFLYVPLVCPNVGNRISILNIHHQTNTQKRGCESKMHKSHDTLQQK